MIRLVVSDLGWHAREWIGILVVTIATGFVGAIAAGLLETGASNGGDVQVTLIGGSGVVLTFSTVTALIVLSSSANLTVTLQQRSYALWQLAGIRPRQVGRVVLGQLIAIGILGAVCGSILARVFFRSVFEFAFADWPGMNGLPLRLGAASVGCVAVAVVGTIVLGGLRGVRRASRVAPIEALREPEPPSVKLTWFRMLLAAATATGIVWMALAMNSGDFDLIMNSSIFVTPMIAALLAAAGPVLFPLVLRAWTACVPSRASAAWYLARHSAAHRLSRSTAAISPLMVAVALTGGLYTTVAVLKQAFIERTGDGSGFGIEFASVVLMLGGPLLLSGIAAAATVFMSSHAREREFALVQAAGSTRRTIVWMSVFEAGIYAITATILGLVAIAAGGIITVSALELHTLPISFVSVGLVAGGGFALLLVATLVPTLAALRTEIPRTLAVE